MRLSKQHAASIRQLAEEIFGDDVQVRLFGSRLDDRARGGDVDLLVESSSDVPNPAVQSSNLEARVSRLLQGRKVDVLIAAPNLALEPIHRVAIDAGVIL